MNTVLFDTDFGVIRWTIRNDEQADVETKGVELGVHNIIYLALAAVSEFHSSLHSLRVLFIRHHDTRTTFSSSSINIALLRLLQLIESMHAVASRCPCRSRATPSDQSHKVRSSSARCWFTDNNFNAWTLVENEDYASVVIVVAQA